MSLTEGLENVECQARSRPAGCLLSFVSPVPVCIFLPTELPMTTKIRGNNGSGQDLDITPPSWSTSTVSPV